MSNPTSAQVLRAFALVEALAGNEFAGMSVTELMQVTGTRSDQVVRDLANLLEAGWAERMETGRYRLGARPVQVSLAFASALERAETDLAGIRNRYTRSL